MPPTIRADPISTCTSNHSQLRANPTWSPSQPCHEHPGGLLFYSTRKQHLTYTHSPSLPMGSLLPHTGVCSAAPPHSPQHRSPLPGSLLKGWPPALLLTCRSCTWW